MKIKAGVAALVLVPAVVGVCDPLPTCPGPVVIASQPQTPGVVRGHGTATVEFCLPASGRVEGVRLVQSSGDKEFDDAAIATVAGGYYVRPTVDGKPVACCTTMQVKGLDRR
jgi:TonB family protein